jgi:hypothetical protein
METDMKHLTAMLLRSALVLTFVAGLAQECAAQSFADLLGQITAGSKASGDATLNSLGGALTTKAQALNTSLAGNASAQGLLQGGLSSLLSGNGASSLGTFAKLSAAKFTPEQTKLAKEVGNVGSAYVVQKNFSSLEGAQGDVAQIVNSLRKGTPTAAIPAMQNVAQNAKLTPAQKEVATSLVNQYVPGAKKARDFLGGGLKSFPGFGK